MLQGLVVEVCVSVIGIVLLVLCLCVVLPNRYMRLSLYFPMFVRVSVLLHDVVDEVLAMLLLVYVCVLHSRLACLLLLVVSLRACVSIVVCDPGRYCM